MKGNEIVDAADELAYKLGFPYLWLSDGSTFPLPKCSEKDGKGNVDAKCNIQFFRLLFRDYYGADIPQLQFGGAYRSEKWLFLNLDTWEQDLVAYEDVLNQTIDALSKGKVRIL
jgi:hypothetical protein